MKRLTLIMLCLLSACTILEQQVGELSFTLSDLPAVLLVGDTVSFTISAESLDDLELISDVANDLVLVTKRLDDVLDVRLTANSDAAVGQRTIAFILSQDLQKSEFKYVLAVVSAQLSLNPSELKLEVGADADVSLVGTTSGIDDVSYDIQSSSQLAVSQTITGFNVKALTECKPCTITVEAYAKGVLLASAALSVFTQSLAMSLTPNIVSMSAGDSASLDLNIVKDGVASATALSSKAPAGFTVSLASSTLDSSTTVTLLTAADLAGGVYAISFFASAEGLTSSQDLLVTVNNEVLRTISLQVTPASLDIEAGNEAVFNLGITKENIAEGLVLSYSAPDGIALSLPNVSSNLNESVTLSVVSTVVKGTYRVDIMASFGDLSATASLTVNVSPFVVAESLSIEVTPSPSDIEAGTNAVFNLGIIKENIDSVALSFVAPIGFTVSMAESSLNLNEAITIAVEETLAVGQYVIDFTASVGELTSTASLTVNVTAAQPNLSITITPTEVSTQPGTVFAVNLGIEKHLIDNVVLTTTAADNILVTLAPETVALNESVEIAVTDSSLQGFYVIGFQATAGSVTATATLSMTITLPQD